MDEHDRRTVARDVVRDRGSVVPLHDPGVPQRVTRARLSRQRRRRELLEHRVYPPLSRYPLQLVHPTIGEAECGADRQVLDRA